MPHLLAKQRTPENKLNDALDYAQELAYGALSGWWEPIVSTFRGHPNFLDSSDSNHAAFRAKWLDADAPAPTFSLLAALGYLQVMPQGANSQTVTWLITRQAFDLLKQPFLPTRIFISYRRRESSAFALLLEARLRLVGVDPEGIFIDKDITLGELWEQRLQRELAQADYFVCLIGPSTLDDESWVLREVETVHRLCPSTPIIPVCHNGSRLSSLPAPLASSNGYEIGKPAAEETALDYEMAVNYVLNALGYRTY